MTVQLKFYSIPTAFEITTGKRIHPSTACRYALRGCQGVILQTWMIGGHRKTTVEAVNRFIAARTAATTPRMPADPAEVSRALMHELS